MPDGLGAGGVQVILDKPQSSQRKRRQDIYPNFAEQTTVTNIRGEFAFNKLGTGLYRVRAKKNGYATARPETVEITAGSNPHPVRLELVSAARIYGHVRDVDGNPVSDASIRIIQEETDAYIGNRGVVAKTDVNGFYEIKDVPTVPIRVGLLSSQALEQIHLEAGEELELDFNQSELIKLGGIVSVRGKQTAVVSGDIFLRPIEKGYPNIWINSKGAQLAINPMNGEYEALVEPGDNILWYQAGTRLSMVDRVHIPKSPSSQTQNFEVELADVSIIVLLDGVEQYLDGIALFDQRLGDFTQPRVFSRELEATNGFIEALPAGEYRVEFTSNDSQYTGQSEWTRIGRGRDNVLIIDLEPLGKGTPVGKWMPGTIDQEANTSNYNVTPHVTQAGNYQAMVHYDWGAHGVHIEWVALLANGSEVARDVHPGWSGTGKRNHTYMLPVTQINPGAMYTLQVHMRSEGGTNSYGTIYWLRK